MRTVTQQKEGHLNEELGDHCHMAEAIRRAAAIKLITITSQFERIYIIAR